MVNTQQLIEFSKRTSHGGRHGEWSTEKKEILCAYFLGNSFPNMAQREGLGRQVGLEVSQSARLFVSLLMKLMDVCAIDVTSVQVLFKD